jgi:hypothetical protein
MAEGAWDRRAIWALPIFGGVIGGVVGAMLTYEQDQRRAVLLLALGFVVTAIAIVLINTYGLPGERLSL